ncbi:biotin synthase BioB [bacterium]|nr:biotin synthase BioB [bacterium]
MSNNTAIRNNWTKQEVAEIYQSPLLDLVYQAATLHREFHKANEVQVCTLLSIKTGGCAEDCGYCSQSVKHQTEVKVHPLLDHGQVMEAATNAKHSGATRFCMGAAWREVRDNRDFDRVLEMVKDVSALGLEVCCTLGMLTAEQAGKLKAAGLYAYNHNLDTGEDFYKEVITTRTYQDRLNTLKAVREAGLTVCCGGIIGLGESSEDRIDLLTTLANFDPHPESVPINLLVKIKGTPLEYAPDVPGFEMLRMVATARILMPKSMVRLSAGRLEMSEEMQAFCFLAGANSIFGGDKLLTTPNPAVNQDQLLFKSLGLEARKPYTDESCQVRS